jgi:hypothetical protein
VPKLEDGFESLSRVRAPDVWAEALQREPRPEPTGPSGPRRFVVAAVALAVFLGGFLFVTSTFDRTDQKPGSSESSSVTPTGTPTSTPSEPTTSLPHPAGPITPLLALPGRSTSIAADPGGPVFVSARAETGERTILRWDPATDDVLRSDPIPGSQIAFASGWLWATGDDGRDPSGTPHAPTVYRLDPATLGVAQTVDLPSVPGVIGAAPDGAVWVGVGGQLVVLDASTGAVLDRFDIEGTPTLLAFDPSGAHAYVVTDAPAGRDGDLLVEIDPDTGDQIATAAVGVRELNGPSSLAATNAGVWVNAPTGTMAHVSLLAEGTLQEVEATQTQDATSGSNGQTISSAAGVVWLSDLGGVRCFDPETAALRDAFDTSTEKAALVGRGVVETSAGLLMDGSPYVLRLDPPAACGPTG